MSTAAQRTQAPWYAVPDVVRTSLRGIRGSLGAKRSRLAFVAVAVAGPLVIILLQLVLSIFSSSNAFEIDTLQTANKDLSRSYIAVNQRVSELSSPSHLARTAEAMGMVPSSTPAYLRLSDGNITGHPTAASSSSALMRGANATLVPNAQLAGAPRVSLAGKIPAVSVAGAPIVGGSVALPKQPSGSSSISTTK